MIKGKVLGKIKPETIVVLNGKYNLYLIEDDKCYADDAYNHAENPQTGDICWFDEWFWTGDVRQLKQLLPMF
jgi:hypothetical protein